MKTEKEQWEEIGKKIRKLQGDKISKDDVLYHCFKCPNYKECDSCKTLWNKIDCFVGFLYEEGSIYISNGTERIGIVGALYDILEDVKKDEN